MNRISIIALATIAGTAAAQCGSSSACGSKEYSHTEQAAVTTVAFEQAPDIVDTAVAAGTFNTLAAALTAADLIPALKGDGPFTVFAPTDEAFAKLPAGTVENLLKPENKELLQSILLYHVVEGEVKAETVVGLNNATTLNGQRVDIAVNGGRVTLDESNVIKTDIETSNGVIHVIDTVLIPTDKDIVETASAAGSFNTLLKAATEAGLVPTLTGEGPFTVFAPTDEAFAKLPAGTIASLLEPENKDKLTSILLYHVVPGRVYSDQLVGLIKKGYGDTTVATAQGSKFTAKLVGEGVKIDNADVLATDIEATNGVIHVIDEVIIPE